MIEFIRNNSTIISVIVGFFIGTPILWLYNNDTDLKAKGKTACLCMLFSCISVLSVVFFASIESYISGMGFTYAGVSTYGLYLVSPFILFLVFRNREKRRKVFDEFSIYIQPSMIIQRIRCLINGCCYGKTILSTSFRWPTREVEIVFYFIMLIVLLKRVINVKKGGSFPLLMIDYGLLRFVEEFFRYSSEQSIFHLAHIWSVLSLFAGLSIYSEFKIKVQE